jgi:hypothetical protein
MFDRLTKKGLPLSIIVGTLLVPLTALAAIWVTDPGRRAEATSAPTTSPAPAWTGTTQTSDASSIDITADLQAACGPEGLQLVSLEESGTITDVQQAALDALREVCADQGIPLPESPPADVVVQTVVIPATATASAFPSTGSTAFHESEDEHEFEGEHEFEVEHETEDEH